MLLTRSFPDFLDASKDRPGLFTRWQLRRRSLLWQSQPGLVAPSGHCLRRKFLCVASATACLFTVVAPGVRAQPAPQWEAVGHAGFSAGRATYISTAFGPDGKPYIAYRDEANLNKATVMRWSPADLAWKSVGSSGFSEGQAFETSLAFSKKGRPHVAFADAANEGKITVLRFTGGSWQTVGTAGFSEQSPKFLSLTFSADDRPYVAYQDGVAGKVAVMRLNKAGTTWEVAGASGPSAGAALYPCLTFGPDGKPYVAFMDPTHSGKATVVRLNGDTWENVATPGFSAGIAGVFSLRFSPDGDLYVAFSDGSQGGKITVMRLPRTRQVWELVGSAGFTVGQAAAGSMAFGPDAMPYLAYAGVGGADKADVMRFDKKTNAWESLGPSSLPARGIYNITLNFGPDGRPYVTYSDAAHSEKATMIRTKQAVPRR